MYHYCNVDITNYRVIHRIRLSANTRFHGCNVICVASFLRYTNLDSHQKDGWIT